MVAGSSVSFAVAASGQSPLFCQWTHNGTPLDGATNSILALSDVFSDDAGNYAVVVSNAAGVITSTVASLSVMFPPVITTSSSLPDGLANLPYSQTLEVTNGVAPFEWLVVAGDLPAGVSLAVDTGVLSGTPTTAGCYSFRVRVTGGAALSAEQDLSLTIQAADHGFFATHSMLPYLSPGTNMVSCQVTYPAGRELYYLLWQPVLPPGWTLLSARGDGLPEAQDGDIIFTDFTLGNPLHFTFKVLVAAGQTNTNMLSGWVTYLMNGMADVTTVPAAPDPLAVAPAKRHTADYQSPAWVVDGAEVSWVLAYWRAQHYHRQTNVRDGFAVGTGNTNGARHDADFQEPYWVMDGTEVNRLLAYWRAKAYHPDPAGADGYAPGQLPDDDTPDSFAPALQSVDQAAASGGNAPVCSHAGPAVFIPNSTIRITNTITYSQTLWSLLWRPVLPSGWTLLSVSGSGTPELVRGEIVWTGTLPASPIQMVYTVQVPSGGDSGQQIGAEMEYHAKGLANAVAQHTGLTPLFLVPPGPVVVGALEVEAFEGPSLDGTGTRPMTFKASANVVTQVVVNGLATWQTNSVVSRQWNMTVSLAGGTAPFALANVPSGTTHISVKAPHCLRKRVPVVAINGQPTVDFTAFNQLAGGDVDESNQVASDDYFLLATYWYVSVAQNPAAAAADFNGDGFCDILDYLILVTHWYEHGDPE